MPLAPPGPNGPGRAVRLIRGFHAEMDLEQPAKRADPGDGVEPGPAGRGAIPDPRPHAHAAAYAHGDARGLSHARGHCHVHPDADPDPNALRDRYADAARAHADARGLSHDRGYRHVHPNVLAAGRTPHPHSNGFSHASRAAGGWSPPAASSPSRPRGGRWGKPPPGRGHASAEHGMGPAGAGGRRKPGASGPSDRPPARPVRSESFPGAPEASSGKAHGALLRSPFPDWTKGLSEEPKTAYN